MFSKLLDVLLFCIDSVQYLQGYTLLIGAAFHRAIKLLCDFSARRCLDLRLVNDMLLVKVIIRVKELRLHMPGFRALYERLVKHVDALLNLFAVYHYL